MDEDPTDDATTRVRIAANARSSCCSCTAEVEAAAAGVVPTPVVVVVLVLRKSFVTSSIVLPRLSTDFFAEATPEAAEVPTPVVAVAVAAVVVPACNKSFVISIRNQSTQF